MTGTPLKECQNASGCKGTQTTERRRKKLLPVHHCCLQAPVLSRCLEASLSFTTGPLAPQPSWGTSQTVGGQWGRLHCEQERSLLCSRLASLRCSLLLASRSHPLEPRLPFEKQEAISWSTSPDGGWRVQFPSRPMGSPSGPLTEKPLHQVDRLVCFPFSKGS